MTESKFRERRSAYREESTDGPDSAPSESPMESSPATDSVPAPEPGPVYEPPRPPETGAVSAPGRPPEADGGTPSAELAGEAEDTGDMDLDRLEEMEVPEPSFLELIEPHVEMALRFLGELPLTPDGTRRVLPRWARREIDMLGLLEERTRGNLPADEQAYLVQALDHLRTLFLKVGR